MNKALIKLIKVYQYMISPLLGNNCRYSPSCSEYMLNAIEQYGVLKGFLMGTKRLLRCGPWGSGGYDPVPPKHNNDLTS